MLDKILQFIAEKLKCLPIANGGTGATTGDGALKNLGAKDYVLEQGFKDGWNYRKWSNGTAECWRGHVVTITSWSAWGSIYLSQPSTQINYPTNLFVNIPNMYITPLGALSVGGNELTGIYVEVNGSNTKTPSFNLVRPVEGKTDTAGKTGVSMYAIGEWK